MEQGYYIFWFIITFIIYYIASMQKDNQKKIMYYLISALLFIIMGILSFGTYNLVYDSSTSAFVQYNEANFSLQSMLPFGISLIFAIISGLELMICIGNEWNKNFKGLKTPLDK
jgi:hypothetical protein